MTNSKIITKMSNKSYESIQTPTVKWLTDHHSIISKPFDMAQMRTR